MAVQVLHLPQKSFFTRSSIFRTSTAVQYWGPLSSSVKFLRTLYILTSALC